MSVLNSYFDKIFCINLDRRTDRWEESLKEFNKYNLDVERFPAIDGKELNLSDKVKLTPAEKACSMSHHTILKRMIENNWNRILILEDDVAFIDDLESMFTHKAKQIPKDW